MKTRLTLVLSLITAVAITSAAPAFACSVAAPPVLEDVLVSQTALDRPVTGLFEVKHIARVPGFGLRDARSVSVVTRYWGEKPPNTGRVSHGSSWMLSSDSCGNGDEARGTVLYSWTDGSVENRGQFSALDASTRGEPLTAGQEAEIEAVFGPAVELDVSAATRAAAWAQILWLPAALVTGVILAGWFGIRRLVASARPR